MDSKAISWTIKRIAHEKGIKLADLARKTNYTPEAFAVKISRGIPNIEHADKILNALDCELVVVDKKTKKVY